MKLFVYGIFLNEYNRDNYGMSNEEYATVKGWATEGSQIVSAVPDPRYTLTGLLVDVAEFSYEYRGDQAHVVDNWKMLDALEHNYDRIVVETTDWELVDGDRVPVKAYMYVKKGGDDVVSSRRQDRRHSRITV